MRKTRRTSRVGETVRDALVEVFRHDLKDVRLAMVSIMTMAPDYCCRVECHAARRKVVRR